MMAGYRPKSLDELNSIFDKTMAAEKAIKKSSSLLEKGEDSFSSFSAQLIEENEEKASAQERASEEITDSVSEFIARFSEQTEKEPIKAKPQMTVLSPEPVKKEYEIENDISSDESDKVTETEKPSRDELMDEYMKIMSDEEDEFPQEKKLSRKEKKKLRKKDRTAQQAEIPQEPEKDEESPFDSVAEPDYSEPEAPVYEETAQGDASAEEKDDFDFPENYTPEWIKDEEKNGEEETEAAPKKKKGKHTLLKILLSLILVAVISVGALATVFKTVVAVNTGKLLSEKYYVFTTYEDYSELGLSEGELVITEKKYAEDGEVFAYVDYASKSFEFGRRIDSITKEDGEVLYVTEKDGGRTLVSRDDCKGVVYLTYSGRGNIISFLTDNYIIVVAAAAVISLIIVLLLALALRTKKEEEYKAENEELSEETEEDFEDIFSTIE